MNLFQKNLQDFYTQLTIGQKKLILKLISGRGLIMKDKKLILKKIMKLLEPQKPKVFQNQEEEEYKFSNFLISESPIHFSIYGLKTSLIIVNGFLFLKNL